MKDPETNDPISLSTHLLTSFSSEIPLVQTFKGKWALIQPKLTDLQAQLADFPTSTSNPLALDLLLSVSHTLRNGKFVISIWLTEIVISMMIAGQSETFLQKAIQEQGRGQVLDTINEIQERHDAVKDMEKNLQEKNLQVFLDMAVLVQAQGEQLDDIESHMQRASSFVRGGTQQLGKARVYQKNTRKWTCFLIILLLVIV